MGHERQLSKAKPKAAGQSEADQPCGSVQIIRYRNLLTFVGFMLWCRFAASITGAGALFHNRIGFEPGRWFQDWGCVGAGWEQSLWHSPSPPRRRGPWRRLFCLSHGSPPSRGRRKQCRGRIGFVPEIFLGMVWNQWLPTREISLFLPVIPVPAYAGTGFGGNPVGVSIGRAAGKDDASGIKWIPACAGMT